MFEQAGAWIQQFATTIGISASLQEEIGAEIIVGILTAGATLFVATAFGGLIARKRAQPLREHLAEQLFDIHAKLQRQLSGSFDRSGGNEAPVLEAVEETAEVVGYLQVGLNRQERSAVQAYRQKLQALGDVASELRHRSPRLVGAHDDASSALHAALRKLRGGRLAKHWRDVLEQPM